MTEPMSYYHIGLVGNALCNVAQTESALEDHLCTHRHEDGSLVTAEDIVVRYVLMYMLRLRLDE